MVFLLTAMMPIAGVLLHTERRKKVLEKDFKLH